MSRFATVAAVGALVAVFAFAADAAGTSSKTFKGGSRNASPHAANTRDGMLDIEVCNRSRDVAKVGLSFIEPGDTRWANRGWFTVNPGQCSVLGQTDNATFYGYADVDGDDRSWQGNHPLCVEYPGPYTFFTSGDAGTCGSHQEARDFVVMTATEVGKYTWNLDP